MFVSETYNLCRFTCTFSFFQILHKFGNVWSVVEPNVFVCVQHTVPLTQLSMWGLVVLVAQSCPTLCNPMDCIVHQAPLSVGILQARLLEWVAIPFSRGIFPTQGLKKCTINVMQLNHPETIGFLSFPVLGKIVFHETGCSCSKYWGPLA